MHGPTTRWNELRASARRVPDGVGMLVQGAVLLMFLALPVGLDAQDATETQFWTSVVCKREGEVRTYLRVYPNGAYVDEARTCLEQQLNLPRADRILVQRGLAALDYAAGAADGLFGPATRAALRQWQTGKGFAATGYLTRAQADALMAAGRDVLPQRSGNGRQKSSGERQRSGNAPKQGARHGKQQPGQRQSGSARQKRNVGGRKRKPLRGSCATAWAWSLY